MKCKAIIAVMLGISAEPGSLPQLPAPKHSVTIPDIIIREGFQAGVPPHLALAVAWRESNLEPWRVSKRNRDGTRDWGLFGLNDHTIRVLRVAHPLDAKQNTIAGVGLLGLYLRTCGSERAALYAYARGRCPGAQFK